MSYLKRLVWKQRPDALVVLRDAASGVVSALVTIAYCISFSALIFHGGLEGGLGLGLTALLMGSAVTGIIVALNTTLPPADAGPDTPAVAVMSVLAATVGATIMAQGSSSERAVEHVLLAISLSTLLTGVMLFALGAFRLGPSLRFVPYPVIGGFLAASGWLLLAGAAQVVTGNAPDLEAIDTYGTPNNGIKLVIAVGFAVAVLIVRRNVSSFFVLPAVFLLATVFLGTILHLLGLAREDHWFLGGGLSSQFWWPASYAFAANTEWWVIFSAAAEISAVCGVTAIALLLDVSSLEVARGKSADLDREFRTNGLANAMAAMIGGAAGNLSLQSSILIEEAGGATRLSGVCAALTIVLVLVSGLDVSAFVPTPVLGGLLIYLGILILLQALTRLPARRSWTDAALSLAIMLVIIWFGYLVGVVVGIAGACLMFAFSYSRVGVVRRHLTRSEFASNVQRSLTQSEALRQSGNAIHIFWLSGFIFFGSSNRVFEFIRRVIDEQIEPPVRFIVLDCKGVPGFDTSAGLSIVKLRNHCDRHGVALVFAGLELQVKRALDQAGIVTRDKIHKIFPNRNDALEWCEEQLLGTIDSDLHKEGNFEAWLVNEVGPEFDCSLIQIFFKRNEFKAGTVLYEQGQPSDTIDLIASGRVAIVVNSGEGPALNLRCMTGNTVIGEMGFFRARPRAASVVAERDGVVYTLTRESFNRLLDDEPAHGAAFMAFIIRVLADRIDFANREIAALV